MGYFGLSDFKTTAMLCAAVFNILSIVVLYRIASPLDKYRRWVVIGIGAGVFLALGYAVLASYTGLLNIFDIEFDRFGPVAYTIGVAALLICFFCYIGGVEIYDLVKRRKKELNAENK